MESSDGNENSEINQPVEEGRVGKEVDSDNFASGEHPNSILSVVETADKENSDTFAKLNINSSMELDKEDSNVTVGDVPPVIPNVQILGNAAVKDHADKTDECMETELAETSRSCNSDSTADEGATEDSVQLNNTKIRMLAKVAVSDAHFKHQQRGEPDLILPEKIEIAQAILESNKVSFLAKFGSYLELEDLEYFSNFRTSYEIDFYCKQVEKSKSKHFSENRVKNRRYQALKELISKNEYFSDEEMKFREPYLYHQMIGQHLTDEEIQATIDKSDLKFSSILVRHIDQLNENERFNIAKDKEEGQEEEEEDSDEEGMEECEERKTEEDEDKEKVSLSDQQIQELRAEYNEDKEKISDEHRQELRAEFLTIMQERFLQGGDKNFNYSQVDNNEEYDDLNVLSHDAEEKYFDDEDPESIHSDSNM